ncbi:hypothetical protein ANAEL_00322 [Anaerolineales bacterium]|nr:hypothetical protein ANAEL_00322 [Anaerolineales bacterium]
MKDKERAKAKAKAQNNPIFFLSFYFSHYSSFTLAPHCVWCSAGVL